MTEPGPATPVAIIGIGCRFPGGVSDVEGFWRLLVEGQDAIGEIPGDRIDLGHYFDPAPATPGRMMTRWGGFLDGIDRFDAAFFGISPREAERLDPQQRLLLEIAWEALEDAGQDVARLDGTRGGVFVGQWLSDFEQRLFADPEAVDFSMTTGSGRYAASGRLSCMLGLRGPSLTVDTACSSSLAAVHLAVRSIRAGESSIALAGGVNVILQPQISIAYSQSRMMAPDGRCKFGDAAGDGYVRSEGAGLVVLKPLDQAVADGDRIHAVIRGSALNNDGSSGLSMGTPSRLGQEELLRTAYADAGVSPGSIAYVEAHGTGTRAGDPVELAALGAVLAEGRVAGTRALVGSVKTNIGHTEGAAGMAGLIKAALAVERATVPPSLHFHEPNPGLPWAEIPCEIPRVATPWPTGPYPRRAGVSAFGIAGTNGHVVLEAHPARQASGPAGATGPWLLPLSARSPAALRALSLRHADLLCRQDAPPLGDVCRQAATRRTALSHRAAFVAQDPAAMADALRRFAAGGPASTEGVVHGGRPGRVAFVVPGQGAQWTGMGRELMAREPVFRDMLEQCDGAASRFVGWSIMAQLAAEPGTEAYLLDRIDVIQPVLIALALAYAALLRSWGIVPDMVFGHSMGEVGAACIAGILDVDQAMEVICRRSTLMRQVSGQGLMALVELPLAALQDRLTGLEQLVSPAASNGPRSSVMSGAPDTVRQVMAGLERDGVFCRLVKVDVASHSPQMDGPAAALAAALEEMKPRAATLPILSTSLGRVAYWEEFGAAYWARNLRQPVLFLDAVQAALADGATVFVELGPHPILLPSVGQTAPAVATLACGRRGEPEHAALLAVTAGLWTAGQAIDWARMMPGHGHVVELPLYPWQRERHWAEAAELRPLAAGHQPLPPKPDAEARGWLLQPRWRQLALPVPAPASAAAFLVVGEDRVAGEAVVAAFAALGQAATLVAPHVITATGSGRGMTPAGVVALAPPGISAAFFPLQVLQTCLAAGWRTRIWLVTQGGQAVDDSGARVDVDQAALWGAARVMGEEHPEFWGGLVDLDPAMCPADGAAMLAAHVLAPDGEDQAAFRAGLRHVPRLAAWDQAAAGFTWRRDATYLVTGGLGDVGLHVARAMAEAGARRLILLGRTALPPRTCWADLASDHPAFGRVAAVRALEAAGVAVHTPALDIADAAALAGFLAQYAAEGWPSIRGVVHAAGLLDSRLAATMDQASFEAVLAPKLRGAVLLDALLPALDLFVLMSSITAFLPQPGIANYAAANAGLDGLAQHRRTRGQHAISIAWGPWQDSGLLVAGKAGSHVTQAFARQGIAAFAPAQGTALFLFLCGSAASTAVVLPVDWAVFRRARAGRPLPLARDMLDALADAADPATLPDRLRGADAEERRTLLQGVIAEALGRVLKIAPGQIDPRQAFGGLGLNSLMAIELRNRLETTLGRALSATLAWNYPTMTALAAHLAEETAVQDLPPSPQGPVPAAFGDALDEVAGLSDAQAMQALLAGQLAP